MFCPKCGTKSLDGATFCQECGAKLIVNDAEQQVAASTPARQTQLQTRHVSLDMPKKKKFNKLPIIIGAVALVFVAVIAINWNGKNDYEATVRAHQPFISQGTSLTYGEVLDKYIVSPIWKVNEFGNEASVDINGTAKGTEYKLMITITVTSDSNDTDSAFISLESVTVDGEKSPTKNDAVNFLLAMFLAYDKGYEDLSELFLETGISGMQDGGTNFPTQQSLNINNETLLTEKDAIHIAQQFLDEHPLYLRTITGVVKYEPADKTFNYDFTGLYHIELVADDGSNRSMWVSKETGDIFISPDGNVLLTGEEYYETIIVNGDAELYAAPTQLDASLYGRWRATDGSILELSDNGTVANVNFQVWIDPSTPDSIIWEASNGQIIFDSQFNCEYEWSVERDQDLDVDVLTLIKNSYPIRYHRMEGTTGEGLIGQWDIQAIGVDLTLNPDGTGMVGNSSCIWQTDGVILWEYIHQRCAYDYYVSGDMLELFFSDGSKTFIKVGN